MATPTAPLAECTTPPEGTSSGGACVGALGDLRITTPVFGGR